MFERRAKSGVAARQVCFWLYRGETKLVEGSFTVMSTPGISCFGVYRELPIAGAKDPAAIFEGAVLEHELNADLSASISLRYLSAQPSAKSAVGFEQVVEVKAGLSMGSESGADRVESVMLGNEHEFVFRTHKFA
jgi:hypothetical protein